MPELSREEKKEIVKEAINEWLDAKYAEFGKRSLHGVAAAAFGYAVYFLITNGWIK
jgi:hypothetical protein